MSQSNSFSALNSDFDMDLKARSASRRPLIIVTVVFIIVVVVVGVVTWKVTKDSYESGSAAERSELPANKPDTGNGGISNPDEPKYTEEELRKKPWLSLRMTRDVLPVHYDITMYPDFYGDAGEFYGNETIELQVKKETRFFLIHIHNDYLNVTNAQLQDNSTGEDIAVDRTFYYSPNEFYVIEASRLVNSAVKVKLQFEGSLTKAIVGIYKSTYFNTITKETRSLATSKFEPTYARRAFPCFDEPNIKAEFTITLVHRPGYKALSNMPQDGLTTTNELPGLLSTKFQRSVEMSTYLVCFIVCDFESIETTSADGKTIRVYATPDKIGQTQYALDMAKHTIDAYKVLFNMSYPLPKQDLIAIPDFVSGAMEHWGLITFRESRLLYDPNQASLSDKETVAHVVAHEMAHQWFGNIVTMDWWNDLWLNEGFASYMEYVGIDGKEPAWDIVSRFLVLDLFPVMSEDSELSSHPIIVDVERPRQITAVFDSISYSKGSSVIRMLEHIMGEQKFFSGIAAYLKKFKWGNAKTDDLWQSLSEVDTVLDVKHIMDTWTIQDGFPYVNITLSTDASGLTTVSAKQKRFMSNPATVVDTTNSPFGYKWYISLDYKSSSGTTGQKIMDLNDIRFSANLGLNQANSWVKFNHEQFGFYRVLYPDDMWRSFSQHLTQNSYDAWALSAADRAGLLNDAFKMADAGLTSYSIPLEMMSYMEKEQDYVPWRAAISGLSTIKNMLQMDPNFGLWKKFLKAKINPAVQRLGYIDEGTHNERLLRPRLMTEACDIQDSDTVNSIEEQFHQWLDSGIKPAVNLRKIVYKCGMANGGTDADWNAIWNKYLVESSPQEKELLALALGNAKQPHLIAKLLENAKNGNGIKRQDFFTIIINIGRNPAAKGMLWDWTRENYQAFIDRFTINDRYFGRMVYYMARNFNTDFKLKEVKALFTQFPEVGSSERYRKMVVERIEKNIYWMENYKPIIVHWLERNA